jgi:asparagine synthase (glutamine-hydrolysing)
MCGITGWLSFDRDLSRERELVGEMTRTMACRGPDAEGIFIDGPAALGHRRLAVIDIEGGAQPMTVEHATMVYSGEAYNFVELREQLQACGERFQTSSDTEVVLRGYLRWGEGVAEHLNGMYALAIWDARLRKLVLIRDRMGIKPLYVYRTSDGILFGSEPKAILTNPMVRREVTAAGLAELFSYVKTPGQAVWEGMREVEPGTVMTVSANGVCTRRYWRLETRDHRDLQAATVARVRELLDDIVARQLVADVPRCVLLSGGLDSSAVTALSAIDLARVGERVRTFAVDFVGQTEHFVPDEVRPTPDTPYVHDVAEHVDSEHTDIVLDHGELSDPDVRRTVVRARDLPMGLGDLDTSLYLLCQAIRERSTVALSGESADELFGGYRQFHDPVAQRAHTFPWLALPFGPIRDTTEMLRPEVASAIDVPGYQRDSYATALQEVSYLDGEPDLERRMRVSSYLHLTRFVRSLLDRKDRMSMRVGLEVRVPFCDHRLVEYVYNAPWALKTYDGREKSLLRGAVADVLPDSVVERVKSPYPSTQDLRYVADLQLQARALPVDHDVFSLVDTSWVGRTVEIEPASVDSATRHALERTLDMAVWMDLYRPSVRV